MGAGDPVAIVLPNCPQHIVAFYAVLRLGAVVVEHNPLYTPRELRKQFEDHGAKTAIVWSKVVETVQEFPDDLAVTGARERRRHPGDAVRGCARCCACRSPGRAKRATPSRATSAAPSSGSASARSAPLAGSPPAARHGRPRDHPVHERHDRHAQGRVADARNLLVERRAGAGVGADASRAGPDASSTPCCRCSTPTASRCASPSR